MSKTLYKQTRLGKIQQWTIWVEDQGHSGHPEVWIEHGLSDGKKQTTFDVVKSGVNIGKSNETTALEQAILTAERKTVKQIEEGYRDSIAAAQQKQDADWAQQLPKELCFYKPKSSIDDKKLKALEQSGRSVYTVKRDGMAHIVRKSKEFGVEIYSRRMDLVTDKYPHLIEAFNNLNDGTTLLGEIVLLNGDQDDFNGVSQICRSDPEKAIQRQKELGWVSYYIFDLAFHNEINCMITMPYEERLKGINDLAEQCGSEYVLPVEIMNKPHREAMEEVKQRKLEGLVIWDKTKAMKPNECYTQNGKAYRPNVLWKSKPRYELDAIARFFPEEGIGEYGTGKNHGKMKSVYLYQLDDEGNEIYISKCGGGFSDEQRLFFTTAEYPRVFRVLYDSVQKDGSLRFPVFDIDREDKAVDECFLEEEIKAAMFKESK